jgi:hypothetical protein
MPLSLDMGEGDCSKTQDGFYSCKNCITTGQRLDNQAYWFFRIFSNLNQKQQKLI